MSDTRHKNSSEKLREYNARRKKKYKRRRKTAAYLVLLFVACLICLILALTVFFNTNEIRVVGNERYSLDEVITASEIETGDNLLRMNREKIYEKIKSRLPYISEVKIIRELPSTVVIKVTETGPACAYITGETQCALLSDNLTVMEKMPIEMTDAAILRGVNLTVPGIGETAVVDSDISEKILRELLTNIRKNGILNVTEIDFVSPINVNMTVGDRLLVKIGSGTDMDYKTKMVKTYIEDCLSSTGQWSIDVSSGKKLYASRVVIKPSSSEDEQSSENEDEKTVDNEDDEKNEDEDKDNEKVSDEEKEDAEN